MMEQVTERSDRTTRRRSAIGAVAVVLAAVLGGVLWWSGPSTQVPVPGAEARPETVVRAYIDAANARDFDTANEIDARPASDLGRFSRPVQVTGLSGVTTRDESAGRVAGVFDADFDGTDASMEDGRQSWGYVLERGEDGLWHIVDEGIA